MKKYKNILMIISVVLCLIIAIHQVTYTVDKNAINSGKEPKFIIDKVEIQDGGTLVYYGLGYQIIKWNIITIAREDSGSEKQGHLTGLEIYRFPFYNRLEKGGQSKVELKFVSDK